MAIATRIDKMALLEKAVQTIIHSEDESLLHQIKALLELPSQPEVKLTEAHKRMLDQELAHYEANRDKTQSWEQTKAQIKSRHRQAG